MDIRVVEGLGFHLVSLAARLEPVFGLFLASGFCGLLYQVVWLRLAFAAFSGSRYLTLTGEKLIANGGS